MKKKVCQNCGFLFRRHAGPGTKLKVEIFHQAQIAYFGKRIFNKSCLAILRLPTRPQLKGSYYFSLIAPVVARFLVFVTDVRTNTMCENNDHLIGRGLVGQ